MNNILKYALICLTVVMSGCQDDIFTGRVDNGKLVFLAKNENDNIITETRTALQSDGLRVKFVNGDAIKIYDGASSGDYSTDAEESGFSVFTGSGVSESADTYYAVYPSSAAGGYAGNKLTVTIPSEQATDEGTFDPKANVGVAKADKINDGRYHLEFKNVGNLVKFHITDDNTVTAIIIKGNNGEDVAGTVDVNLSDNTWNNATGGSKMITLVPATGTTFAKGDYYAVVLPQTYEKGLSVKLEHSTGSYHFKRGLKPNVTMERNKVYQLFGGDFNSEDFSGAAMLPSLFLHDGQPHYDEGLRTSVTFNDLKTGTTKIVFHAEASDAEWAYAAANNKLDIIGNSDVRGYVDSNHELHIYTKESMFSIPEDKVLAGTNDGAQMFNGYSSVTAIENLSFIDVTFLKSFKNTFYNCNKLKEIDISGWDTSSATTMSGMFRTTGSSAMKSITLGESFVLNSEHNNIFGLSTTERTPKIMIYASDDVKRQFTTDNSTNSGSIHTDFNKNITFASTTNAEFLSPNIPVSVVGSETHLSFTMGGNSSTSEMNVIEVGLIGYEPSLSDISAFTYKGTETVNGKEYKMYDLTLTDRQKFTRNISLGLLPKTAGDSYLYLRTPGYESKEVKSEILSKLELDVKADYGTSETKNSIVSELTSNDYRDYTEKNWPITGQKCKITFYLKSSTTPEKVFVSNGIDAVECDKGSAGSGEYAGYTAYTTKTPMLVSSKNEVKSLAVNVQISGQTIFHQAGTVNVDVYAITIDEANKVVLNGDNTFVTGKPYVFKNPYGQYLYTVSNSQTSNVKTRSTIDNYSFWQFSKTGVSGQIISAFNTQSVRCLQKYQVTAYTSSGYKNYTVEEGLKFKSDGAYLKHNSSGSISSGASDDNNEWSVYLVTFTAPAAK